MAMIFDMMMCYYSKRLTELYDDEKADQKKDDNEQNSVSTPAFEMSKL